MLTAFFNIDLQRIFAKYATAKVSVFVFAKPQILAEAFWQVLVLQLPNWKLCIFI